jgi:DNA polymerase I-like protein with 3'-5' exonuclease and polymerase domains
MPRIALIDKAPNRTKYEQYFEFEFDHYHLCSTPLQKILKKDVDIEINTDSYDFVVLVGAEPTKHFAKASVTNSAGLLLDGKWLPISNPAMLAFRPEGKPDFERAVSQINKYISGEVTNSSITGDFKGIDNEKEAEEFLEEVLKSGASAVALDTETTALYPRDGFVLGISISYKLKHGRYILSDVINERGLGLLQEICDKYQIVFHNRKFDQKMLAYHFGLKFKPDCDDTMVEHYVLDETEGTHGLKGLAIKYTTYGDYDKELDDFREQYCKQNGILKEDFTYDLIPFNIISKYAAIDTAVTLELHYKFKPLIDKSPKLKNVYDSIMIPGILFLTNMEEVGIPMSRERLIAADKYLDEKITEAKEKVYEFDDVKRFEKDTGKIFNPNSVQQLRVVLFDYLKLTPTGKLTKAGALSTDAEVLEELAEEHPLPAQILKVRQLGKIRSSYISKILPELDKDDRIRTNFNLTFTTSGRLSSSGKFNAQQIPRDDPIIKGCIQAPVGYKIVSQDLTTAEMFYAAVLSKDKALQSVFSQGGDFHSTIAKMVFDLSCPVEDVKKLFPLDRQAAKAVSFGILYGSGPQKVADTVNKEGGNLSLRDAQGIIKQYFDTFKNLRNWLNERKDFISQNGYTYSFFGRKRRLPNVFSTDKGIASHEVRSGINMEVQSLASDINLLGAIDTANELATKGMKAKIFALVHDSIVALVPDDEVDQYCEIVKRNTQKDRGCNIPGFPIGVDQEVGQDYSFGKFDKKYEVITDPVPCLQIRENKA